MKTLIKNEVNRAEDKVECCHSRRKIGVPSSLVAGWCGKEHKRMSEESDIFFLFLKMGEESDILFHHKTEKGTHMK